MDVIHYAIELYCYSNRVLFFLLFINYILFKIINKKIDLAVYIINFILIVLFYCMSEEKKYIETGKDYSFFKIFGSIQNISYYLFFLLYIILISISV